MPLPPAPAAKQSKRAQNQNRQRRRHRNHLNIVNQPEQQRPRIGIGRRSRIHIKLTEEDIRPAEIPDILANLEETNP
jgi:hypothetical protein